VSHRIKAVSLAYAIYYLTQICSLADVYSVYSTDQQHEERSFIDNISSFNQFIVFLQF
jgi:hypothetical protein